MELKNANTTKRQLSLGHVQDLKALYGELDKNLRLIEQSTGVVINARGHQLGIEGEEPAVTIAECVIKDLAELVGGGHALGRKDVALALRAHQLEPGASIKEIFEQSIPVASNKGRITPKTANQKLYVEAIRTHDIVFGIGPAGTGKTYLAMAMAVSALVKKEVNRIILTRPAVEAGEKLGFLPGDLYAKVHPYLRPLYDALYDMMDADKISRLIERGTIEVAPLAFMRGRTLNDSFIILDEAQNTTSEQMKMFLTRMGFGSKSVITGDVTQIDLPFGRPSGLVEVVKILGSVKGVSFVRFTDKDVVRHGLVQQIVKAYQKHEEKHVKPKGGKGKG
jgi:phosphate starvation-inducible protein PhoH and related proteins